MSVLREVIRTLQSTEQTVQFVQQQLLRQFDEMELITDHPPIVAVNANSRDTHYAPTETHKQPIKTGDIILLDLWAKQKAPHEVFADTT